MNVRLNLNCLTIAVTCIVVCLALLQSQILLVFSADQIGNSTLASEDGAPQKSSKQPSAKMDNGGKKVVQEQINHPPIADAGKDLTVIEGNVLRLDGSSSTDEDGDMLTYVWEQVSPKVPAIHFKDKTSVRPSFVAPEIIGDKITLTFVLTVSDDKAMARDPLQVTIEAAKPAKDTKDSINTSDLSDASKIASPQQQSDSDNNKNKNNIHQPSQFPSSTNINETDLKNKKLSTSSANSKSIIGTEGDDNLIGTTGNDNIHASLEMM